MQKLLSMCRHSDFIISLMARKMFAYAADLLMRLSTQFACHFLSLTEWQWLNLGLHILGILHHKMHQQKNFFLIL